MLESIQKLLTEIGTMLPLYQANSDSAVQTAAKNLEWNAKKMRGEAGADSLDLETWARYTADDFATIAKGMNAGEPGQAFAASFTERLEKALGHPDLPAAAAATAPTMTAAPATVSAPAIEANDDFDLKSVLSEKAKTAHENLDWSRSAVDLFKLLGLDSSLEGRRKVAATLEMSPEEIASIGSESGNTALHSQLLTRLAQTRGLLPEGLV